MRARQVRISAPPARPSSFGPLRWLLKAFWGLVSLFWLPAALVAAVLIWGAPNLLWTFQYLPRGEGRHYLRCDYLGLDGPRTVRPADGRCPYVAFFPLRLDALGLGPSRTGRAPLAPASGQRDA